MIYTITFNPALDLILKLREPCRTGEINRSYEEDFTVGGKGINASRVFKRLKRDAVALGFIGNYTGKVIETALNEAGIKTDFAHIKDYTRTNVKVILEGREETQVNAPGPNITKEDVMNLTKKLTKVKKGDVVLISGGLPKSLPLTVFDNFLKLLVSNKAELVISLFGAPLLRSFKYKPYLVSINDNELADTLYIPTKNEDNCIKGAKRLIKMGAQNVVITRGDQGAIFVNNEMVIKVKAPKGRVINTIGAGDALLAAFVDEYLKTESFEKAIKKGVIYGSASAFSANLIDEKMVAEISKQVK